MGILIKAYARHKTDENIMYETRRYIIAQMQSIVYREFLPAVLPQSDMLKVAGQFNPGLFNPDFSTLDSSTPDDAFSTANFIITKFSFMKFLAMNYSIMNFSKMNFSTMYELLKLEL